MTVRKVEILICDEGVKGTGRALGLIRKVISLWSLSGEHLATLDTWDVDKGCARDYSSLEELLNL